MKKIIVAILVAAVLITTVCIMASNAGSGSGAEIDSASLTIGSDLTLNYYVSVHDDGDYMMSFEKNGKKTGLVGGTVSGDYLVFSYDGISPQCMFDRITATLWNVSDGKNEIQTKDYSVAEYAVTMYDHELATDGIKTILRDLIAYGRAARDYSGYTGDDLHSEIDWTPSVFDITGTVSSKKSSYAMSSYNKVQSAKLILGNVNYILFTARCTDSDVRVTSGNVDITEKCSIVREGDIVYVRTYPLKATQNDTVFKVTVYNGNGILHEVTYSANSYILSNCSSSDLKTKELVKRLYCYGKSAEALVGAVPTGEVQLSDNILRYNISRKEDFYIPLYDWYRKTQDSFDGTGKVYWNNTVARQLGCNWINVFPAGGSRDGSVLANPMVTKAGAFLLDYERIISYTAKSLQESHQNGIKVMTSAPIAEVWLSTWNDWGIDPTSMLTMHSNGERIVTKTVNGKESPSHACNNDPNWRNFLIRYTERVAEAGFDGCLYDGYTYAYDPGYYCCCEDCRLAWKKFCLDLFGSEKPMPTENDLAVNTDSDEIDRAFMLFRLKTQSDFYNELLAAGKKYVPGFEVYINSTMYDISLSYFYLNGLDITSSEFKHDLGHENSSFMYLMNEALTDKQLISFTNVYTSQYDNINEYYVELMTAFANGGAMCEAEVSRTKDISFYVTDVTKRLGNMLHEEEKKFSESGNAAKTAVLYSYRDTAYYQVKGFGEFISLGGTNVRETYDKSSARRIAVNLAREGIPYAFLIAETKPSDYEFSLFDTVIVPELTLLDNYTENRLQTFVRNGGNLIITGNGFGKTYPVDSDGVEIRDRGYDVFEKWTGTSYGAAADYQVFSVGNGKVIVSKSYVTDSTRELNSSLTDGMINALALTGSLSQVIIETQPSQGYINASLRANGNGTEMYLHLVNYDVDGNYIPESYTVSMDIPDGAAIAGVSARSPFYESADSIGLKWNTENGRLYVSGNFNIYSMLTVELSYE